MADEINVEGTNPSVRSEGTMTTGEGHTPTYGEKAVGLSFNPSGDPLVNKAKQLYADVIDLLVSLPVGVEGGNERSALIEMAVRQAQIAQMCAVKAITYKF